MAFLTVEGIYRAGRIELTENNHQLPAESRVLITFLPGDPTQKPLESSQTAALDEREALRQQAFAQMEAGIPLGGPPYPRREELYDRGKR